MADQKASLSDMANPLMKVVSEYGARPFILTKDGSFASTTSAPHYGKILKLASGKDTTCSRTGFGCAVPVSVIRGLQHFLPREVAVDRL